MMVRPHMGDGSNNEGAVFGVGDNALYTGLRIVPVDDQTEIAQSLVQ